MTPDPVIAGFFRKYHAVATTRTGDSDYATATDAALIGHADADCKAWDRTLPADVRLQVQNRLARIGAEVLRRKGRLTWDDAQYWVWSGKRVEITRRIGWVKEMLDAMADPT